MGNNHQLVRGPKTCSIMQIAATRTFYGHRPLQSYWIQWSADRGEIMGENEILVGRWVWDGSTRRISRLIAWASSGLEKTLYPWKKASPRLVSPHKWKPKPSQLPKKLRQSCNPEKKESRLGKSHHKSTHIVRRFIKPLSGVYHRFICLSSELLSANFTLLSAITLLSDTPLWITVWSFRS